MTPVLDRLDPLVATPAGLTAEEVAWLVELVRDGLLDSRALPERLRHLVPAVVPSRQSVHRFEFSFGRGERN